MVTDISEEHSVLLFMVVAEEVESYYSSVNRGSAMAVACNNVVCSKFAPNTWG
jgi:hypothetical protein